MMVGNGFVVFFKQKTADESRMSDGSSDVCSSDLLRTRLFYGETVKLFPPYKEFVDSNTGYVADLSAVIAEGNSYFIHSVLARVTVAWSKDKWPFRLGVRKSVVTGKGVSVSVDIGGLRSLTSHNSRQKTARI